MTLNLVTFSSKDFRRVRSTHHNDDIRSKTTLMPNYTLVRSAHRTHSLQRIVSDSVLLFTFHFSLSTSL
jgi:hypothetical protein